MRYETNDIIDLNLDGQKVTALIVGVEMEDDNEESAIYDLLLNDGFKKIRLNYHELIDKIIKN